MKKDNNGFLQGGLDPAVAAAIGNGRQRQAERAMPRDERKRVKRERAKAAARKGNRALYDLPEEMIEAVKKLAEGYGTSASQIAKLAIWIFLRSERTHGVDIRAYRVPAGKNPKYDYVIELPE